MASPPADSPTRVTLSGSPPKLAMASRIQRSCSPPNHLLLRLSIVCLRHYIKQNISCKNYNIKSAPPSIFYCISLIPDNIIKSFCLCPYFFKKAIVNIKTCYSMSCLRQRYKDTPASTGCLQYSHRL